MVCDKTIKKEVFVMETSKKDLRFFVILTYVGFYIALGLCFAVAALGVPMENIAAYAPIIISWVSFAVVMIWAKKLLMLLQASFGDYGMHLFG